MRARVTASLNLIIGGPECVRHLLSIEYALMTEALAGQALDDLISDSNGRSVLSRSLSPGSPFVYNSRHTINLHGELVYRLQGLVSRRYIPAFSRAQ
ncbi:MAG: hypothetical protein ABI222_15125, partial [Opitutaceae bacterium]